MLTSYRRVLAEPGTLRFSATGLFARLPISMVGLGIVLLVSAETGSYGVAGAVSAAYMLTNAGLAILQGRLVDNLGQARVLTIAACAFGVAMAALVVSVRADWPIVASYACAALAGGALPQIGSCIRARWSHALSDPADIQTAYAIEAVADEAVFMLGPIIVTVLATAWDPVAGLAVAVVSCVAGTLALCAQRGTEPPAHPHHRSSGRRVPMPWATVVPLAVVCAALGTLFGAAEVATVAFAREEGSPALAGPLLALWALGSLVAGALTGAVTWRRGPSIRVRWGAFAMFCAMVPLHFVGSVPLMGLVLLLGGFAIAPTLIGTLSLTEQSVPAGRLTEGMSIMQTGLVAGVAPGATLAGVIIDAHGASAAYLVCVAAGAVAAAAAQALPRQGAAPRDE
ncbi:MAG: major facilitator superfamily 1 [Nocardioides sp.]|nr:major facilitator superfamily 1 [Nocardioides sp.]